MNIEFRIAQLERLLSDVASRRARVPAAAAVKPGHETAVAGWNGLEQGFRSALDSLKLRRDSAEIDPRGRCA